MNKEKTFWGIRAGRHGEEELTFVKEGIIAVGWNKISNVSNLTKREQFKKIYKEAYPEAKNCTVSIHAGIMYRFVCEMQKGDIVIFPRKINHDIWIGEIIEEYKYKPKSSFPHTRKVKWIKKNLSRTRFSQGALYEIGAAMSLFQVRNYFEEFASVLMSRPLLTVSEDEDKEIASIVADDIEQLSRDFVLKKLKQKLKGHDFAEFIAHLLNLMGYNTKLSKPGPDRGIDIIAYKDDLGVESPTIKIQVKSNEKETNEAAVSELYGKVSNNEFGIIVSLGGFNKRALDFAFGINNLRLLDENDIIDLICKYYSKIDSKYKGIIPLRMIYIPESE